MDDYARGRPECLRMSFSCHGAHSALLNAPSVQPPMGLLPAGFPLCQMCNCLKGRGELREADSRRRLWEELDYRAIE